MTNTIVLQKPIVKLYKRCAWQHHAECPGSFESWSVCSCSCHHPNGMTPEVRAEWNRNFVKAAITEAERITAIVEAEPFVMPVRKSSKVKAAVRLSKYDAKPKNSQYLATGLPGPMLPRNLLGGLVVSPKPGSGDTTTVRANRAANAKLATARAALAAKANKKS